MNFLTLVLLLVSLALTNAAVLRDRLKGYGNFHPRRDWSPVNTTFTCMYMANEPNWAGEGQNLCQIGGICASQIPDGLAANVSSAGPSEGQTCFLYTEPDCAGIRSAPIVYPGIADLNTIGFDKQTLSWRCWKMCGYIIESSSVAATATMQPTIPPPSSSGSTSMTFTFDPTSTTIEVRKRQDITTTISSPNGDEGGASITTTLTGSQPVASITSTTTSSPETSTTSSLETSSTSSMSATTTTTLFTPPAPFSTSTVSSPSTNPADITVTAPSSVETTSFALASGGGGSSPSSSSIDTNTPGFSMSPSPVTVTHTFADGSKTTETTSLLEPVPTVPTGTRKLL